MVETNDYVLTLADLRYALFYIYESKGKFLDNSIDGSLISILNCFGYDRSVPDIRSIITNDIRHMLYQLEDDGLISRSSVEIPVTFRVFKYNRNNPFINFDNVKTETRIGYGRWNVFYINWNYERIVEYSSKYKNKINPLQNEEESHNPHCVYDENGMWETAFEERGKSERVKK